jgi:O-antigen ligase
LAVPFAPSSFWNRMATITDSQKDQNEFTGSREARRVVMQEGIDAFMDRPLTGVGAGQFKNYNPPERKERWREAHNALIQVASETGIAGLGAFVFLILQAARAAAATRRMLSRSRKRPGDDPLRHVLQDDDRHTLVAHTVAMTAGLVGWFVCALFASVAYNWTFYYLLALIVAGRELTRDRLAASRVLQSERTKTFSVPAARRYRPAAPGLA